MTRLLSILLTLFELFLCVSFHDNDRVEQAIDGMEQLQDRKRYKNKIFVQNVILNYDGDGGGDDDVGGGGDDVDDENDDDYDNDNYTLLPSTDIMRNDHTTYIL